MPELERRGCTRELYTQGASRAEESQSSGVKLSSPVVTGEGGPSRWRGPPPSRLRYATASTSPVTTGEERQALTNSRARPRKRHVPPRHSRAPAHNVRPSHSPAREQREIPLMGYERRVGEGDRRPDALVQTVEAIADMSMLKPADHFVGDHVSIAFPG